MTDDPQPDAVTKVARDLSAIEALAAALSEQAEHKANDRLLPGGHAMVALGPVASPRAVEEQVEAAEARWWEDDATTHEDRPDASHLSDEDDAWEPPLQTLLFWSEAWREERGYPLEGRTPTLETEAGFIRHSLEWAWESEPHFADFARDVQGVVRRLENLLYAGRRDEFGVPCMYDACGGKRLRRRIRDDGSRTDWQCPRCERTWGEEDYWRNVGAANERAQREEFAGSVWVTVDYAAREVRRSVKTIRTWVNAGKVARACILVGRRVGFVSLDEVRALDAEAKRRNRRRSAA
jgi:hypothetical protein